MAEVHPTVALSRGPLKLIGGALALDFVNTVSWHLRAETEDWFASYEDLVTWAAGAGALDRQRAGRLRRLARNDPKDATRVLDEARKLREALFRVFRADAPKGRDLRLVNAWLARMAPREGLVRSGGRTGWRWPVPETLESVLAPVLWSAGDLLAGEHRAPLKTCAAEGCGWLFLDASRKANRLWCSMADCGNRAKARRHYRRGRG